MKSPRRIKELKELRENYNIKQGIRSERNTIDWFEGFGDEGIRNSYIKDSEVIIENLIEI